MSTGAAAALEAAAAPDADIRAIVSRGGRSGLAIPAALAHVRTPTLLIVGSLDTRVLGLNRLAADWMRCEHRLTVVPGATHLFEEPGALVTVAELARDRLTAHLAHSADPAPLGRAECRAGAATTWKTRWAARLWRRSDSSRARPWRPAGRAR